MATLHPDGAVERNVWSPGGRLIATIDARGNRTSLSTTHLVCAYLYVTPTVRKPGSSMTMSQISAQSLPRMGHGPNMYTMR